MKKLSNKIAIALGSLFCCNVPFMLSTTTSCTQSEAIELANFESYMSSDLMDDLQTKYNIHFPYYTVSEMIPAKFEKFYDMAVPSGYMLLPLLSRGWLEKIDWTKFDVKDMDGKQIKNAEDAKDLYYDKCLDYMNEQFTHYINQQVKKDPNCQLIKILERDGTFKDQKFNILNYGVPYFSQSYMFSYTGTEIQFYKNETNEITNTPGWSDIFYTVSPQNPNQDERFKNKKIAMVDDARTFYDIARIVESTEDNEETITNDVTTDDSQSRMFHTMSHVTKKFKKREGKSFILNSDSQIISKSVADRNSDACAMMSWSGDTIYAAQGAEEYEHFTAKDLHICKPHSGSLDEIEFIVFNNKNANNKTKRDNIYNVAKQICLDGCEKSPEEIVKKLDESEDARFKYWTMVNWDNILYTPVLKNIHTAITNINSTYWQSSKYDEDTKKFYIDILSGSLPKGEKSKHLYGKALTNLQNSNNHWAWLESRGKL